MQNSEYDNWLVNKQQYSSEATSSATGVLLTLGSGNANASAGRFNTPGHQDHNLHDDEWINFFKKKVGAA